MSDRGTLLPGGERALYLLSSQAAHSCTPNAVVETLGESGLKEMRTIAHMGIAENEAITVSYVEEEALVLPLDRRRDAIRTARAGWTCICSRCNRGNDSEEVLPLLQSALKVSKDMAEDLLVNASRIWHASMSCSPLQWSARQGRVR